MSMPIKLPKYGQVQQYFAKQRSEFPSIYRASWRWEFMISAAAVAGAVSSLTWEILQSWQSYPELIPGVTAFSGTAKSCDTARVFSLLFGFFACWYGLTIFSLWVRRKCGPGAESGFRSLLAYNAIPAVLWAADGALADTNTVGSLYASFLGLGVIVRNSYGYAVRQTALQSKHRFVEAVGVASLLPLVAVMGGLAIVAAVVHFKPNALNHPYWVMGIAALCSAIANELAWFRSKKDTPLEVRRWTTPLFLFQLPLPVVLATVIPTWNAEGGWASIDEAVQPIFLFVIATLAVWAWVELARRFWLSGRPSLSTSPFSALSSWSLVAMVLALKPMASIGGDMYHFGEFLLPWWLTQEFGYVPFVDYFPARGLVNYIPGFFAGVFMDGTAPAHSAAMPMVQLLFLASGLLIVRRYVGAMFGCLMFMFMLSPSGLPEVHLTLAVCLCIICEHYFKMAPSWWIVLWSVLCFVLILFAPGQGGVWSLATLPLAIFAVYRFYRNSENHIWKAPLLAMLVLTSIVLFTPLRPMFVGAVTYVIEHSAVNGVAHGIPWRLSRGMPQFHLHHEFLRSSFLVVAVVAIVFLLKRFANLGHPPRKSMIYASSIALILVILIPRATGRIDPGSPSRIGIISIWALAMLLPLLLWSNLPRRRHALAAVVAAACFGLLGRWTEVRDLGEMLANRTQAPPSPAGLVSGAAIGFPNLGRAPIDTKVINDLQTVRSTLERFLDEGETYVDLTNLNARSFYLEYPLVMDSGAFFNLPRESQQLRAVHRIRKAAPPVALIHSEDAIFFDGCLASLRSHLIYRYLVENYEPIEENGNVFLVLPSRLKRVTGPRNHNSRADSGSDAFDPGDRPEYEPLRASHEAENDGAFVYGAVRPAVFTKPQKSDRLDVIFERKAEIERKRALLDRAFRTEQLRELPQAWGKSYRSLASTLRPVANIGKDVAAEPQNAVAVSDADFRATDLDPSVTFDVSQFELSGADAGILVFDLKTSDSPNYLKVSWCGDGERFEEKSSVLFLGKRGRLVVPLDGAPRWLLCKKIDRLRIELNGTMSRFSIANVSLMQRKAVDQLP